MQELIKKAHLFTYSYLLTISILLLIYPFFVKNDIDNCEIVSFIISWLSIIYSLTLFLIGVFNIFKKRLINGVYYLLGTVSVFALYSKIYFEYYNKFAHFGFILIIIFLIIRFKKKSNFKIGLCVFLMINIFSMFLSDKFLLSYFNANKIKWSENKLKLEYYKGSCIEKKVDKDRFRGLITVNSINYKINKAFSIPSVIVGAYFVSDESCIMNQFKDSNQLKHEKGYIDICEYYTRLIRKIFHNKTVSMVNYKELFEKYNILYYEDILSDITLADILIERIIELKCEMNNKYMLETNYGKDIKNQIYWNSKIHRLLNSFKEFK